MDSNNNPKKPNQLLDEIISPMFGHEYQNRVVATKAEKDKAVANSEATNYLEKQIEEKVEAQTKIEKAKEYQECSKTDTDVLKQYHKQKEDEEIKAALPSNYLDFRDKLEKTSDLSTISEFDFSVDSTENESDMQVSNTSVNSNTVSEILDEIFDQ